MINPGSNTRQLYAHETCRSGKTIAVGSRQNSLLSRDWNEHRTRGNLAGMSAEDPITLWIDQLRDHDPEAAAQIWRHFGIRILAAARRRLPAKNRAGYDEEDAAQSAFHSLCTGLSRGRFTDIQNRDSLWRLLLVIISRKISARRRYNARQCREAARSVQESTLLHDSEQGLDSLPASTLSPEYAAQFEEICEEMFSGLESESLRQVGLLKMEGFTDEEIATRLNCSRRTVQRRLEVIRRNWLASVDRPETDDAARGKA